MRLLLALGLAALTLGAVVPSAFAWHAHLRIKKVNIGGPSTDVFHFKIEKTPNLYEDIWKDGEKHFELYGAPSEAGSWYERYGSGPTPAGANMESFGDLWAGYDHGFQDWVTYKVTELSASPSPLSDYTTTTSCGIYDPPDWTKSSELWTTGNQVTDQYGLWSYSSGVTDGKSHIATSVRWWDEKRYGTICTFTNRYRARVRVKKTFTDTITAAPSVSAEINGVVRERAGEDGVPVEPADTTLEHGQSTEWVKVPVGADGPLSAVTVGESGGDAGDPDLSKYDATIDCGEGITATRDPQTGRWTLGGIKPGQDVTCTIQNTRKPVPPPEVCTPPATGTPPNCTTPPVVCTPPTTGTPPNCTTPPVTPPTAGTTQSGVKGGSQSGTTRPRASARMRGTVGCATAAYSVAAVSGAQVRRVTFYLNGRKVKTLTKANAGSFWKLQYRTKGLARGSYAVRARVEFTKASGAKARDFRLQFSRCSRRAVSPTFTG